MSPCMQSFQSEYSMFSWAVLAATRVIKSYTGVSKNNGTPKSSILVGVFHYKPSILGENPYFLGKHPYTPKESERDSSTRTTNAKLPVPSVRSGRRYGRRCHQHLRPQHRDGSPGAPALQFLPARFEAKAPGSHWVMQMSVSQDTQRGGPGSASSLASSRTSSFSSFT